MFRIGRKKVKENSERYFSGISKFKWFTSVDSLEYKIWKLRDCAKIEKN